MFTERSQDDEYSASRVRERKIQLKAQQEKNKKSIVPMIHFCASLISVLLISLTFILAHSFTIDDFSTILHEHKVLLEDWTTEPFIDMITV